MLLVVFTPFIVIRACNEKDKAEKRQYEQTQEWIQRDLEREKKEREASGISVEERKAELLKILRSGNSVNTNSNGSIDSTVDIQSQNGVETQDK